MSSGMTEPEFPLGGEPAEPGVDARIPPIEAGEAGVDAPIPPTEVAEATSVAAAAIDPDVEVVDGFPVLAEVRTVERPAPAALPTVQVAAVAATGFVAGAATVALVKRRASRKIARNSRTVPRRPADLLPIAATRSFLVDVHVIAKPE
jgi:hypothetical protein